MTIYVLSVFSGSERPRYSAFNKDDHSQRVTAETVEEAVAGWVERYAKGVIDVVKIDHELPPDPPAEPVQESSIDLTWGEALRAATKGKYIARKDWPEKQVVAVDPPKLPHLVIRKPNGVWDIWHPRESKGHTDAKDWRIVS